MSLGTRLALLVTAIALVVGGPTVTADAADVAETRLEVTAPAAYSDTDAPVQVRLLTATGEPVVGATVALERREGEAWVPVATVTTDAEGRATQPVRASRSPADNAVRATYAGDEQYAAAAGQARIGLKRRGSVVRLTAPDRVKDGRKVQVRVRWTTRNGTPVQGAVRLQQAIKPGTWRKVRVLHTDADGRAVVTLRPREDTTWRARAMQQPWVAGDLSNKQRIDNVPPGKPVRLPKGAPDPRRKLPAQARAVGKRANAVVSTIPDKVWNHMTGISWRRGCPVGRDGLRLIRVNYWDYAGYPRRGELVAATSAASAMAAVFTEMYERKLPVRAMYRVDRFGWGSRSRGGDDYASMAAGNTSAFNCRDVTGRPGVRSPHSYGRSLDVNTWENPYRSARGIVPNAWWQPRSHPRVAWRSSSHPVVELMRRHGFRWTYGNGDTQHFDYVGSSARAMVAPRPCDRYCD